MHGLDCILKREDPLFYLYQFPTHLYTLHGDVAHDIVNQLKDDEYMGLREAWKLIDPNDIEGADVCEYGCNIGATSHKLMTLNPRLLFSFDISPKAICFCKYVKRKMLYNNWYPYEGDIRKIQEDCDVAIWEDPHTTNDDDYERIIVNLVENTRKCIYFLECDNIWHMLSYMLDQKYMEQLSENSWKFHLS